MEVRLKASAFEVREEKLERVVVVWWNEYLCFASDEARIFVSENAPLDLLRMFRAPADESIVAKENATK